MGVFLRPVGKSAALCIVIALLVQAAMAWTCRKARDGQPWDTTDEVDDLICRNCGEKPFIFHQGRPVKWICRVCDAENPMYKHRSDAGDGYGTIKCVKYYDGGESYPNGCGGTFNIPAIYGGR